MTLRDLIIGITCLWFGGCLGAAAVCLVAASKAGGK